MEKEKILQEEYIIKLKKNDGVWDLFEKKPDENVQKKLEKYKKRVYGLYLARNLVKMFHGSAYKLQKQQILQMK